MLTSNLDAIFRATHTLTSSAPTILRALPADSPTSQSLERLYEAATAFQEAVTRRGSKEPGEGA